ncbi:hypothetical protein [Actinacidiphila sp. ITFR-21]|uniref:hypothetical protein n=1 Tax=Actinacidiphila sp. ITFR-21 TaxID=3075199 RepID=UPI00288A8D13|nr:hypothetical protein [Streptomyces sp. ITFR-21]WNI16898.1 hypothetical protein RLT57_16140 [Streptomyces sp. ITFR-21]
MTVYDTLASLWRTLVPVIVGTLAAWLAHAGIGVDSAALTLWLGAAFSSAYYTLFRLLEAHVSPAWGWLLGLARPPHYPDADGGIAIGGTPAVAPVPPTTAL